MNRDAPDREIEPPQPVARIDDRYLAQARRGSDAALEAFAHTGARFREPLERSAERLERLGRFGQRITQRRGRGDPRRSTLRRRRSRT